MRIRKMLLVTAAVVVASLSFANPASTKEWTVFWTCNSDGYIHIHIYNGFAWAEATTVHRCGPIMNRPGAAFNLIIAERTQVSATGREFLDDLERKGGIKASRRGVPVEGAGPPPTQLARAETIRLHPADVGPSLAAFLTSVSPDWQGEWRGLWVCCVERTLTKSPPGTEYWVPGNVKRPPLETDKRRVRPAGGA
ncbi:MAG: hypothetical protein HY704_13645 [Gemmatimonadetes bacterium]|nr:hypothetical protein [Gemmatimonadota bacterium]